MERSTRRSRQFEARRLHKHGTLYAHVETYVLLLLVVVAMLTAFRLITITGQAHPSVRRTPAPPQPAAVPVPRRLPLFGERKKPIVAAAAVQAVPLAGAVGSVQGNRASRRQPHTHFPTRPPTQEEPKCPFRTSDLHAS